MTDHREGLEEFARLQTRFHSLMDIDPSAAVAEARTLPDTPVHGVFFTILKAGTLIDAGSSCGNSQAIREGVEILKRLLEADPNNAVLHYNLGNGLVSLADQVAYSDFDWYLVTREDRREARRHFERAAALDAKWGVTSTALTNLGNAFWKAHRWVEAYDAYSKALEHDPTNGIAATGAAKILLGCAERHIGDRDVVLAVAARHLQRARKHPQRIAELAGARAFEDLSALLGKDLQGGEAPDLSGATGYEKFVAQYRLALSPTIEGLNVSLKRWDSLRIESLIEPVHAEHGVPPLFAMFNVLKADFLAARLLAYNAQEGMAGDTGVYADTLDYAVYGITSSTLLLAQRACIDVLDKIAVATTAYFEIPGSARAINFLNRWFEPDKTGQAPSWHASLIQAVRTGNTAVVALAELSLDIASGGALSAKREYRHSSTHRFTVLHDIGCEPSRKSALIEHYPMQDFGVQLIESLQLTRAALLYFVELVALEECQKSSQPGLRLPLIVPTHHSVRGAEDENDD